MIHLRKSTASQEVLLGPFLDDTDGKTAETALTIANTDIKLWKRGGTTESNKNSGGATHIASGRYYAVLDATDTDTTGELIINVAVAGALPVRLVCCVYEAAVFDAWFASGAAGYQVPIWSSASATVNLSGTTVKTLTDAVALPSSASINITGNITGNLSGSVGSVTGAVGSVTGNVGGNVAGSVGSVTGSVGSVTGNVGGSVASVVGNVGGNVNGSVGSVAAGGITSSSFAAGAITANAIAASALNGKGDWQTVIWTSASATVNLSGTTIKAVTDSVAATVADKTGYKLASDGLAAISAWTVAITGNLTGNVTGSVNSVATTVSANVTQWNSGSLPTIGTSTLTAQQVWEYSGARTLSAFSFTVSANVTQWASGALPTIPTAGQNADAVWDEDMSGHTTAGTYGGRIPRSDTSNVEVKITGSKHLACDVHELQPGVIVAAGFAAGAIDAAALAADAAAEIAAAVRTNLATELARLDVTVGSRLADGDYTAPPSATTIADTVLGRSVANSQTTAAEWSLATLVLAALESTAVGSTWTIYRTDGTTVHAVKTLATDANAEPVTGVS